MQSPKAQSVMQKPCWWKKKDADAGIFTNAEDHQDELAKTSMGQQRICLKKTFQGMMSDRVKKHSSRIRSMKISNEQESGQESGAKEAERSPAA